MPQDRDIPETNGAAPKSGDARGVITRACPVGVDRLLRRIVVQVEALGLQVFAVIDHSGDAFEVGLDMPDTKLVLFGSPTAATPLIVAHPLLALDLPLKLLIWECDDHDVFVTYNDPGYLAERYRLSPAETNALRVIEAITQSVTSAQPNT
jgi:uncharacterized protein (DUF302 family)